MQASSSRHDAVADQLPGLAELAWMFLCIAGTSFGGFMAMISVVQNVVVERRRLLRDEDVLNGLSLAGRLWFGACTTPGQMTQPESAAPAHPLLHVNARLLLPAALPVLVTPLPNFEAGMLLKLGSAFAGMFAPTAALTVLCARLLAGASASPNMQAALRGVRAAATGMVFAAAVLIGKSAAPHWIFIALFGLSLIALMRYRVEAIWVVPAAAVVGLFLYQG